MNTKTILFSTCLAAFAIIGFPEKLSAVIPQLPPDGGGDHPPDTLPVGSPLQLVTNFGQSSAKIFASHGGEVEPVILNLNGMLSFTLQLPTISAGSPVLIGILDGGQINVVTPQGTISLSGNTAGAPPSLIVSNQGTLDLTFQAGSAPGLYRVLVTVGADQYQLQFFTREYNAAPPIHQVN
jgi:hypothetical protein